MSKLIIEPSPHIKSGVTTQKIMLSVIIALLPALVASVWIFGLRALIMTVICCTSCVIFEWACRKIMKRNNTISDLSAVVTGMLLAFNLPVTLPFYMAIIGCFVAIVIVKQFFGGIGQNFANPAITGRIVLMLSFTSYMTTWAEPSYYRNAGEIVTTSTPLVSLKRRFACRLVLRNNGRLYRRNLCSCTAYRRNFLGGCPCNIARNAAVLYRYGVRAVDILKRKP